MAEGTRDSHIRSKVKKPDQNNTPIVLMLAISVPNMAVRGDRITEGYSIAMMATTL